MTKHAHEMSSENSQRDRMNRRPAQADSQPAIALHGLTKRYGGRTAVDRLELAVPAGSAVGFIGPNGAGKTTTMAMLLGLVIPSSGTGTVLGHPIEEPGRYLSRVGALIEGPAFYPGLTGIENLHLLAVASDHAASQIPSLIERVGLAGRGDDRYRSYSMGMKQRLGIAAALLGDPELLILDEPTNGLDPAGIHEMRGLIGSLVDGRRTVFVSSHALSEVQAVCDWLVIIDRGRRVFAGPVDDFVISDDVTVFAVPEHPADVERLLPALAAQGLSGDPVDDGATLAVRTSRDLARPTALAINRAATEQGCLLAELRTETADLEAQFLAIVNGGIR
jgi:ABC-2 type transport system ATP-binding protein